MGIFDDLAKIQKQIEAAKPKDPVDIILSTKCPAVDDKSVRVEFEGKWYLIAHWVTVLKIKAEFQSSQPRPSIERIFNLNGFMGIPVIENETLVAQILWHVHLDKSNSFELTDEAFDWIIKGRLEA